MKAIHAIGIGAIVVFAIPVGLAWYVYRGAQWERTGFGKRYDPAMWRKAGAL